MTAFNRYIAANGDDGFGDSAGGFDAAGNYVYAGNTGGNTQRPFFRFANITIPPGSTILTAIITFVAYFSLSGTTCKVKIYAELAANPAAPTTKADLYGRTLTTSNVAWTLPAFTGGTAYNTPDFAAVMQEIINQATWASGNAVQFILPDDTSTAAAVRSLATLEHATYSEAYLQITYTEPSNPQIIIF